jgi:hypothetical protein
LVTAFHNILARWRNHFTQLLNIDLYGVNDVRKTEIHTAEPLVPEPSAFEFEIAVDNLIKTQITRYLSNPSSVDYSRG